jgi:zinc protease
MLNRTIAPPFREIDTLKLLQPGKLVLANGCPLYYFNSGEQDLVRIEFIFNNLPFDKHKSLLNAAVNTMLIDGTSEFTAAQIADQVDFYGAFLQPEYGYDQSQLTLYSLNKHLHHILPVIKAVLTDAVFPEKELQTYIRNQQQKLKVNLEKNDFVARRKFNKALYGDTLYGLSPELSDYEKLQREDLLNHFKKQYQPSNCTIIIAGKADESLLKLVQETFGYQWADDGIISIPKPEFKPSAELFTLEEKPEALQSAIRIGIPTINRKHEDFPAFQVLNTVLGGYFGSRLMANIREDKGYTYGIGSGIVSLKHTGTFFLASEVGADVCRDTFKEIEKEIRLLQTELIPEDELALVRNFMLGSMLGSLENVFSHADKFKNVYFSDMDYSYYERYAQVVKTITAEELLKLANTYLDFDKLHKVVVGKF